MNITTVVAEERTLRVEALQAELERAHVPGLSVAKLEQGKIVWEHAIGFANQQSKAPVSTTTVFEAASLSKPVLAMITWQLVEQGKLSLDQPLFQILPHDRIQNLANAEKITPRLVLSHQTGLPNWGGETLDFNFSPGTGFGYSGEGYVYLQRAIETITGKDLQTLADEMIFTPLGMQHSRFTWQDSERFDRASAHDRTGSTVYRWIPDANGAASLHTTAHDYALFMQYWMQKATAQSSAFNQPQIQLDGSERGNNIDQSVSKLGWGLGWGIQQTQQRRILWHWGDNGESRAFVAFDPLSGDGLVYFANSQNGIAIARPLMHTYFADLQNVFSWLGYPQADEPLWQIEQQGYIAESEGRYLDAIVQFSQVIQAFPEHSRHATRIVWLQDLQRAIDSPTALQFEDIKGLVGQYGPRNISWNDQQLVYQRGNGTPYPLVLLDNGMFALTGVTDFRIEILRNENGFGSKIIGYYMGGGQDQSPRSDH